MFVVDIEKNSRVSMIVVFDCLQEAAAIVDPKHWVQLLDTDEVPKKRLAAIYRAPTPEMMCYLDFSVSTTGMLAGVKVRLLVLRAMILTAIW